MYSNKLLLVKTIFIFLLPFYAKSQKTEGPWITCVTVSDSKGGLDEECLELPKNQIKQIKTLSKNVVKLSLRSKARQVYGPTIYCQRKNFFFSAKCLEIE